MPGEGFAAGAAGPLTLYTLSLCFSFCSKVSWRFLAWLWWGSVKGRNRKPSACNNSKADITQSCSDEHMPRGLQLVCALHHPNTWQQLST